MKKFTNMNRMLKDIGIKTFGDLYHFKSTQQQKNETLEECVERYYIELMAEVL